MSLLHQAIIGSLVFTALGIALLLYTDVPPIVAWLNIGFFGLGGVIVALKQISLLKSNKRVTAPPQVRRALSNNNGSQTKGTSMGADAFVAFYGIKLPLDPDDEETLDACGLEKDPRCVTAKNVGLQSHTGRMTNGEDYFLYLGVRLAWLGLEHEQYTNVSQQSLADVMTSVRARLKEAGFSQEPSLHLQFVGQY